MKNRLIALLRSSERYTKTDMVYLASGSFWSVIGQIASSLAVFVFAIIVARFIPKEVYGEYKYIIATVALLSTLSLTGIGTTVFQSVARGFDGALEEGFWMNVRWSALVFLGAFALAMYYFFQGNSTLAFGILIGGSLSPLLTSANLAGAFLNAKKDFARYSIYFGVIETFLSVGALIITALLTHNTVILVIVYFLSNTLATLWLYRRVVRIYTPDKKLVDQGMLTYGKHISLMGILDGIANNIDQVLVFHFVGPIQLAVYNFAVAIPEQTKGPLKMLDTMTQAKFVNRSDAEVRSSMRNKMLWITISILLFIALYILFAPSIYTLFFPNYVGAVFYSQIYALSLLSIIFSPSGSWIAARKKVREQYLSTTTVSVVQILIMVIGVLSFGLLGLVIARVVTKIAGAGFNYLLYKRAISPASV